MKLTGKITRSGAFPGTVKEKKTVLGQLGMNPSSIPVVVDHELSLSSTNPVQNRVITQTITNRLWSDEVKDALLQIAQKVAYIDADGQDYYDALYDALYPPVGLDSIGAVFDSSATIYNTDTLDDLKQYLVVTAYYSSGDSEVVDSYTLSGSMDAGTQTITVAYGGKTTTFTVTVVEWLVSISAVFTQGSAVIYDTDSLDTLEQYLVVTATYADSTTAVVTDYTLSGTLTVGTSTITVSYGGKTDTFNATVTAWTVKWSYLDGGLPYTVAPNDWTNVNSSYTDFVSGVGLHFKTRSSDGGGTFRVYPKNYQTTSNCVIEVIAKIVTMPSQNGVILRAGNGTIGMQASFGNNGLSVDNGTTMVSGVSITTNTDYTFRIICNVSGTCYVYLDGQLVSTVQPSSIGSKNNHIMMTTGGVQMEAYISAIRFYTV